MGFILLALPLVSCAAIPSYDDPKRVGRIAELREARDLCLIQNAPQFDDGASTPATSKLVDLAIPYPSQPARNAFQQEAARLATGYVLTARRIESDASIAVAKSSRPSRCRRAASILLANPRSTVSAQER